MGIFRNYVRHSSDLVCVFVCVFMCVCVYIYIYIYESRITILQGKKQISLLREISATDRSNAILNTVALSRFFLWTSKAHYGVS